MENKKISVGKIIEDQEKHLSKQNSKMDIFKLLLDNAIGVDFVKRTGVKNESKLKRKDVIVVAVDELLELAESLDFDICVNNGNAYIYNRYYWSRSNEQEMSNLLGDFAQKIGIRVLDAKYFRFKLDLYNQLVSTSSNKDFLQRSKDKTMINLRNGTLEFNYGKIELRNFDKRDFLTYQLNFDYDENATCPMFDKFLDEVLLDKSLQQIIAEYFGSVFIPNKVLKLEKVLFLYGKGSNGKSVLYEIIEALLGRKNFSSYSLGQLTSSQNVRFQIKDKLLNFSSEVGNMSSHDTFKKLASRESIDARSLYNDVVEIEDYAKLAFNCNILPKVNEITYGYFRRFLIIPFEVKIPKEKADKKLSTRIIEVELSGILNWILKGLMRLLKNEEFTNSSKLDEILENFIRESDTVRMFLDDHEIKPSNKKSTKLSEAYDHFKGYCIENGFKTCSRRTFSERMGLAGFTKVRKSSGYYFNLGF